MLEVKSNIRHKACVYWKFGHNSGISEHEDRCYPHQPQRQQRVENLAKK